MIKEGQERPLSVAFSEQLQSAIAGAARERERRTHVESALLEDAEDDGQGGRTSHHVLCRLLLRPDGRGHAAGRCGASCPTPWPQDDFWLRRELSGGTCHYCRTMSTQRLFWASCVAPCLRHSLRAPESSGAGAACASVVVVSALTSSGRPPTNWGPRRCYIHSRTLPPQKGVLLPHQSRRYLR